MVDAPKKTEGLSDFFKAQGKKKQKKPAKATNANAAEDKPDDATASSAATPADTKQADAKQQDASQAKAAQKNTNTFVDSDEEAEADVKLDNTQQAKLNDAKAQTAKKQKDQQQNADEGWSADKIFGSKETKEDSKPANAAAASQGQQKKSGVEGISFGNKPTFKRQEKGIIDKQSFPDFDGVGKKGSDDKPFLKKDMGYQMDSGSATQTKKQSQNDEKMQMPIFKGRFKIDSGITAEEVQKSKMNYDMSSLKMSAAASKSGPKGNESGTGRGNGRSGGFAANDEDDDFEVVTEKKRGGQRKNNFGGDGGDIAFGDRPQFSRGGGRGGKRF